MGLGVSAPSEDLFAYAHARWERIVWMSQNTNQLPTTPRLAAAVRKALESKRYMLYPHPRGLAGLHEAILADLGLRDHDVLITNGGIEATYMALRALLSPGDEVIACDPGFLPIHNQIALSGARPVELPIYGEPWRLTPAQVGEAITPKTRMLLLIDPLNPLGSEYPREDVRAFCELAADHGLYILDDITYQDFAFHPTKTAEFAPERSLSIYSFSKNCGMAGMRCGALLAPPELMKRLAPYNTNVLGVNILSQVAGLAALKSKRDWFPRVLRTARANQKLVKDAVDEVEGAFLAVYPSSSNTLVIDIAKTGLAPEEIQRSLLFDHEIFIRAGNYVSRQFGDRFIRVSFTLPAAGVRKFQRAFPKVVRTLQAAKGPSGGAARARGC